MADHTTNTPGAAGAGTAAATAKAEPNWDERKAALTPYEQKLSTFINRRISSEPTVQVVAKGRTVEAVEYLPGGEGLGLLKVQAGSQEPFVVDCDETVFEMLLTKIIHD